MTFDDLLKKCAASAYPEPVTQLHSQIIPKMVAEFAKLLQPGATVLDIGIGPGQSMRLWREKGFQPFGISVLPEEVEAMQKEGFEAQTLEMHQLAGLDRTFDAVWARHVLEHSPCPLLMLHLICERLNPGGFLYVEVPAPDTTANHQFNPDHFSVMQPSNWATLIARAGFDLKSSGPIDFLLPMGPDKYLVFLARKPLIVL